MSDSILAQAGERKFSILPSLNNKSCLEAALAYAFLGWRVLPIAGIAKPAMSTGHAQGCKCAPCRIESIVHSRKCSCTRGNDCDSPGKHPLTDHGFKDASADPVIIRGWFERWPDANVGIVTGTASGIVVLDRDDPTSALQFDTLTADTSEGRSHLYFSSNGTAVRSSVGKVALGIDIRGEGGYVVAPPSEHVSGSRYQWRDSITTIAPFPTELLRPSENQALPRLVGGCSAPARPTTKVSGAAEPKPHPQPHAAITAGHRNSELFKIASAMRGRGQSEAETLVELLNVNGERCQPPLRDDEVRRIAESAAKQESTQTAKQRMVALAKMSAGLEYEAEKKKLAKELSVPPKAVEDEVRKVRGLIQARAEEQKAQVERERLKAGSKEDGARLLADVIAFQKHFIWMSEAQHTEVAAWILHTHVLDAFDYTAYQHVWSADKRCAKSLLEEICEQLVANPWLTGHTSAAALVRKVATGVTLLLDESDAAFREESDYSEKLRGILNTGFKRTGKYSLCEKNADGSFIVTDIATFGPKMIAGIGRLPNTIADRSLPILLLRKPKHITVEKFTLRKGNKGREIREQVQALKLRIKRWAAQNIDQLRRAEPEIPATLDDRGGDIAEPLFAVADACGGEWPENVRMAVLELRGAQLADDKSAIVELLRDIRDAFTAHGRDKISTETLLHTLTTTGKRWATCDRGRPLNARGLAGMLRGLNIQPRDVRIGTAVVKGYRLEDFSEAFAGYLGEQQGQEPHSEPVSLVELADGGEVDLSAYADEPSD